MDDATAAQILAEAVRELVPDALVVNTPSATTAADGEQPAAPLPWNDDGVLP